MSIRIRTINGVRVALCAARSVAKEGDTYLSDDDHHALAQKFMRDFLEEGVWPRYVDEAAAIVADTEESANKNREWWDRTYT